MADLVATWEVPLYDRTHKISFEHGTTTGRRVVKVDDEVITRRDWMFKLVGSEQFQVRLSSDRYYSKNTICSTFFPR